MGNWPVCRKVFHADDIKHVLDLVGSFSLQSVYPNGPPDTKISSFKGLDGKRLKDLRTSLHDMARDLLPCPMLVALCEKAVEKLSIMNHPDGDCPLCLSPLVSEEEQSESTSFMKLMSCFHCFHSECIVRWWRWLQKQDDLNVTISSRNQNQQVNMGNCPVCCKVFHADDIKHVLDLVGSCSLQSVDINDKEAPEDEKFLQSDSEISRKSKFQTLLQLQRECGGLIEPRKDGVLFASMRLNESSRPSDQRVTEAAGPSRPPNKPKKDVKHPHGHGDKSKSSEDESQASSDRSTSGQRRKFGRKSSRSQTKQWVQKER